MGPDVVEKTEAMPRVSAPTGTLYRSAGTAGGGADGPTGPARSGGSARSSGPGPDVDGSSRSPRLISPWSERDLAHEAPRPLPRDRIVGVAIWTAVVVVGALAVTVPALPQLPAVVRSGDAALWLIAALAVFVDARAFPARTGAAGVYPSKAFTFALLLGWGFAVAVVAQTLAVLVSSIGLRQGPWRTVYAQARYALSFAAAAGVLALAGVPRLSEDAIHLRPGEVGAILLAAGAWFVVNVVLAGVAAALSLGDRWLPTLGRVLRQNSRATLSLLALAPLVVVAGNVSPLLVVLMLVPLLIVGQLTRFTVEEARKATTDELTGLPNRKALYGHMRSHARSYSQRFRRGGGATDARRMALLLLDIDQFRRVNEALGHSVGDRVLAAVAERLREAMGADGLVCRLGGDEFAVLAPRLVDHDAAAVLASRVADALTDPITLYGLPLDVSAAVGVAIYPDHGTDVVTLLRRAEIAMYDAKDHGATLAVYTPEAEQHSPERLELLADLRQALDAGGDQLQLHFQPQVDLATGQVSGSEALLRWNHPERGFVSPEVLIKVAEHTAIMRRITARVLEEAVSQLAKWRAEGLHLRLSVNVSARDLHRGEFVDELADLLADRGVPANQLQIEITEGALMADPRRVLVTLHRLDKLGVALSLDDFGTGYSSMQHLRRLPLAEVKVDRSFVLGMTTDSDDASIVGSIVDLARRLGLRVVAEGVEDEETRRMLLALGCEVGQGWYFARPMPADAFVTWLSRYRAASSPE
jgi:diguanylate cyclase (GGDEF)-like protein